jgi:fatty-acid desaturase
MNRPATLRIKWPFVIGVAVFHVLAVLAFLPAFFSGTGVVLCLLGVYVFGTLGINLGYHRLLTHRGFRCPKWLEHTLVLLGVCTAQQSPAFWVGMHRRHHQFADDEPDPHSPGAGFWWAHMGWFFVERAGEERVLITTRYAEEVLRDPLYAWLERRGWHLVVLLSLVFFFAGGSAAGLLAGKSAGESAKFGMSIVLWAGCVRTVITWHITWAVNSVTHSRGYRNYETRDHSHNHLLLGYLSNGEGWHNNHHADPRSAKHGHRWWELDVAYLTIRLLAALGLVTHVVMPSRNLPPAH